MRIAVISDIHGNYAALDAVLADIARRAVDGIVGLGDFLSGPFDPRAVAARLMPLELPCVRGNHDRWLVEGREQNDWAVDVWVRGIISLEAADWLRAMPLNRVYAGDVFMFHATPRDDAAFFMESLTDDGVRFNRREDIEAAVADIDHPVLLCGHTHVPRTLRLSGGRLVVNPGSVGLPFLLGSPDARYAIIEKHAGAWSAELHAIPYDRAPAQAQARALGHPGFAQAIETGWSGLKDL